MLRVLKHLSGQVTVLNEEMHKLYLAVHGEVPSELESENKDQVPNSGSDLVEAQPLDEVDKPGPV
jgi:hypothetical protein